MSFSVEKIQERHFDQVIRFGEDKFKDDGKKTLTK